MKITATIFALMASVFAASIPTIPRDAALHPVARGEDITKLRKEADCVWCSGDLGTECYWHEC